VASDVSEHDGGTADPRPFANANDVAPRRLFPNRAIEIVEPVSRPAAWHMHSCAEENVALEVDQSEVASGPDIDIRLQPRIGLTEYGPELHRD
jgi:hypothetical protein